MSGIDQTSRRLNVEGTVLVVPSRDWASLVRAVADRRDREAFTLIFDYFAPRIEAYLTRLGLDSGAAEEIAQEVMVTLWRKADLFDPAKSSLPTWLYRIARNRRIDLMRRSRVDYLDPQSPRLLDEAAEGEISSAYEGQERDDILRKLVLTLPEQQQGLLTLAFYEGLSHSQIAERTGTPLGTVKSRLRLAFSQLRRALEAAGIPEMG